MDKTMTLSIKNVPEETVIRLRERARANHRSLQGELSAIIEDAAGYKLTPAEVLQRARARGLRTLPTAVQILREERDAR